MIAPARGTDVGRDAMVVPHRHRVPSGDLGLVELPSEEATGTQNVQESVPTGGGKLPKG